MYPRKKTRLKKGDYFVNTANAFGTASRFIIDTLNDSLVDLPEEGWEMLDSVYMRQDHHQAPKEKSKHGRFWRRR
jgi:hypothetical protein